MSRFVLPTADVVVAIALDAAGRPESVVERTEDVKLLGQWGPHPSAKHAPWPSTVPLASHATDPITDQWKLQFSVDGSATFSGTTHFVLDGGVPVDETRIVAAEFKPKPFKIHGQWSVVGDRLSIITDKPSLHSWQVIAITDRQLVLRTTDASSDKPTEMFWVKRRH